MAAVTTMTTPGAAEAAPPGRNGPDRRRSLLRASPLAPAVLLLLLFLAGPVLYSVYLSLTNRALRGEGSSDTQFVGLANFAEAFTTGAFWNSVGLTLVFTIVSAVIGQNVLGLVLALLMRRASTVVTAVTGSIVIGAWILPEVVTGYLWYTFLGDEGSLNALLGVVGIPPQDLLFSLPILAVSFANIWRGTAFSMLIYTAALSQISPEIEESARMDGAGPARRFFSITLPLLRPSIMTNLMVITLQTLSVFGLIYIMTTGGPGTSSQTLPLYMYERAFSYGQLGYGTAVALILLLIGGVASIAYLRVLPKEDKV
ncbi:carbohydrate ABC transporter permease [Pseudonocardia kunmingensis]|uniref:Carbohydrate ABC transporter membrane protein 1 (CUT1 family) n=1 Tax=Pseudonocardia kunmingensis TaxID=630975 RepID=A0A543DW90_9PSEU|nr:sugar ABC transporter permease [Pseudonocardia kunmingensis]TQM13581.1 carbohydrate ABC transporter membrane protein 1 (CUT1 family) [Pseudonocardia kunmingensis]